jgi:hypothetical protein
MKQKCSSYEAQLTRPNPPTKQAVKAAQPFRADVVNAAELIRLAKRSAALGK